MNLPEAEGQPNWRWCSKCQGLGFAGGAVGAAREELGLPVANADPAIDTGVFQAPSRPRLFHLPRYRLATRVVSGLGQIRSASRAARTGRARSPLRSTSA